MVPTQFSGVYVSKDLLAADIENKMRLYGNITGKGLFSLDGDVTAVNITKSH